MSQRILFVDDDQNILAAYRRNLRHRYTIEVASGGQEALEAMEARGPYAVLVTDMRMPGMNGVEFLRHAKALCPDTVRIMLTGNADLRTAQDAANEGRIFRFLTKPCSSEDLSSALDAGLHQYDLVRAERELLEQTLTGSVKVLTEMLSTAAPVSFGVAARAADLAEEVGRRMGLEKTWSLRIATLLAPIGLVTLPPALLARKRNGEVLESQERELLQGIPEVGARLLASIPRLEEVARIIRDHGKPFAESSGIPIQARIVRAVSDFVSLQSQRMAPTAILDQLDARTAQYDPGVLQILRDMFQGEREAPAVREISLDELRAGQFLASTVESLDGLQILPKGTTLSFSHLEKLHNCSRLAGVREPIQVFETH